MIVINRKTIDANIMTILEAIKDYIRTRDNKIVLRDIRDVGDNIMVTCPFHKNGEERRPSCGISTTDKGDIPAGTVHCFTCGKTMHVDGLISYLLHLDDGGEGGRKWLIENFNVSSNRKLNLILDLNRKNKVENTDIIGEDLLKEYRYIHPYMFKRGLTEEIIEKFDIGYDKYNDSITFPVRNKRGECLFLAKRSVTGKFFTLPAGLDKPLYGIYELDYNKKDLYIAESFFNMLTLVKWGYNAIALMGTGSYYQYTLINKLNFRTIHLCLDGDLAGKIGTNKLVDNIDKNKIVFTHKMPPDRDVNDLTHEEFLDLPIVRRFL